MYKNLLLLHEAITVVLLNKPSYQAQVKAIADEIEIRGLYFQRKGEPAPPSQIRLRATKSKGQYVHLFEFITPDIIKLNLRDKKRTTRPIV